MSLVGDWPRLAGGLALLVVPGSCLPAPAAPESAARSSVAAVAAPPQPMPAPAAAPGRADFQFDAPPEQGSAIVGLAPSGTRTLTLDGRAISLAADGRFLIGFDRDAETGARLVATLADGREVERFLSVAAGRWRLEHVDAPYRGSAANDADFARRRPAERAQIDAARAADHESNGWRQDFRWPVAGRLSGFFGAQRIYRGKPGSYHSGTDVAAPAGTPFVAPADGVVVLAATAPFTLEGNLLMIDHGMGLNSAFLHCQSLDVKLGERVVQGQRLGTVGQTGRATGPHLHWGLKWRDARIDPGKLAGPMGG